MNYACYDKNDKVCEYENHDFCLLICKRNLYLVRPSN